MKLFISHILNLEVLNFTIRYYAQTFFICNGSAKSITQADTNFLKLDKKST